MEEDRGYYRAGDIFYRPSEAELCACAQACNIGREMIESVSPAHPEQQRRLESHLKSGSYMESVVFKSTQKLNRYQKDFLITAFEAVRFANYSLRIRLVQFENRVLQVVLGDRAEWTEYPSSSVYMGYNSVVRMNYGSPLFRYAFLEDEDKPTWFVWTINYSCVYTWMLDMILDDLRAACSDFLLYMGRLWHQQRTLPVRVGDPCWAGLLASRQYMNSKLIHPDPLEFKSLEIKTCSEREPLKALNLPAQTSYIDVELSVVGHAAWALACFKGCTKLETMFNSGDPISPGNPQGYTSLLSPIVMGVQIYLRVEWDKPIGELLGQIATILKGRIVKEHGTTRTSGKKFLPCRMAFRGSFNWDPIVGGKSFAIFDPNVPSAIFECEKGTPPSPAVFGCNQGTPPSHPPSHDYGVQLEIQGTDDVIMIQSAWDTMWGQAQIAAVFESFVYFFEAIIKGRMDTVGRLLTEEVLRHHSRCSIPSCVIPDGGFGYL